MESPRCPSLPQSLQRERVVCSEGMGGRRHGRHIRECLPCQGLLLRLGRAHDNTIRIAIGWRYKQTLTTQRNSLLTQIRLRKLVSLAKTILNHTSMLSHLCCIVFQVNTCFFLPFIPFHSHPPLPAMLQYKHLSPTWPRWCCLLPLCDVS